MRHVSLISTDEEAIKANNPGNLALIVDSDAQYAWPPQDPSRLPNPPPPPSYASAFVYGDEGFNPQLRPSNTATRRRPARKTDDKGDGWVSGDGESEGSHRSGSSPEPYLSDYDDENWGPRSAGEEHDEQLRRLESKVRRGSEGWEIRPSAAAWNMPQGNFGREGPGPAWLEQGRYNVYEPTYDESSDSE